MDFLLKATLIFLNRHDLFYQVLRRIFSTYGIHPVYSDGLCANQLLSDMAQHGHIAQRLRVVLKKKGFPTRDTGFSAVCLVPQNIDMRPSLRDVVIIYWFAPPHLLVYANRWTSDTRNRCCCLRPMAKMPIDRRCIIRRMAVWIRSTSCERTVADSAMRIQHDVSIFIIYYFKKG